VSVKRVRSQSNLRVERSHPRNDLTIEANSVSSSEFKVSGFNAKPETRKPVLPQLTRVLRADIFYW
jgi:hypothetical protein